MSALLSMPSAKTGRAKKHENIRQTHFIDDSEAYWDRKKEKGFCTIPRTLSLVMTLLNLLSKKQDLSRVYFELWCNSFDEGIVEITDEETHAYAAGYVSSSRNIRSWRERIQQLENLGFIKTKQVGSKRYRYILILHPHRVISELNNEGKVPSEWFSAFEQRAHEIGAQISQEKAGRSRKPAPR